MRDVLERVARGETTVEEAEMSLKLLAVEEVGHMAKFDLGREARHGVPEVVIAEGKSADDVVEIAARVVAATGRVIVSRAALEQVDDLERSARQHGWLVERSPGGTVVLRVAEVRDGGCGGRVGIIAAGTSDIGVAEEARVMATEMGCEVTTAYDVGVAGIHRLLAPLEEMVRSDVDVIVAVAGREGALPTLVAGMVDVPLIAVPTSYGYGFGGKGITALMAMLQSCSLGLAVVNIDGGIPAGAVAALIANRAAKYRVAERGRIKDK